MRSRRKRSLLGAALFLFSLLATPAQSASADPPAATTSSIGTFLPQYLHAHGDGLVTGSYCDPTVNNSVYAETLLPNGYAASSYRRQGYGDWFPATCDLVSMATGVDGTLFVVLHQYTNGGASVGTALAAYRNGGQLWFKQLGGCQSPSANEPAGDGDIYYPTLGFNNTLYVLVVEPGQCAATQPYRRLVALDTATGNEKNYARLDQPSVGQGVQYPHIFPTPDGASVLDGTKVKFMDSSGAIDASKTHELATGAQQVIQAAGTSTGQVYVQLVPDSTPSTVNGQMCTGESEVVTQDPFVNLRRVPLDDCSFKTSRMAATPDGGVVLLGGQGYDGNSYDDKLLRYDAAGLETYPGSGVDLTQLSGYGSLKTGAPNVDAFGNVVFTVNATQSGTNDRHVIVERIDNTGGSSVLYSTATGDTDTNGAVDKFSSSAIELTAGGVYLAVCGPTPYLMYCNPGDRMSLVLVSDPGLGFAYPVSAVFGAAPHKLRYVALGDSFSAGEGNPPFTTPDPGTGCDRSRAAYPVRLADEPLAGLDLQAFSACSGATSQQVIGGMNGEPGQLGSLSPLTNVVTLTIGGNDVNFREFATQCFRAVCDNGSAAYAQTDGLISSVLPQRLDALFSAIRAKAFSAQVYVVGYPQIVPIWSDLYSIDGDSQQKACVDSPPSFLRFDMEYGEITAARTVVEDLDNQIADAVTRAGAGFHFVDPRAEGSGFLGHELCRGASDAYFYGPNAVNQGFSFHPTEDGQMAYKKLVSDSMS